MSNMSIPEEINPEVLLCRHSLPSFSRISELKPVSFSSLQPRATSTVHRLIQSTANYQIMMLGGYPGMNYEQVVRELISEEPSPTAGMYDLIYVENLEYNLRPIWLMLRPGSGIKFLTEIIELITSLSKHQDSEKLASKIIAEQGNDEKLKNYIETLSSHIAKGEKLEGSAIANVMVYHDTEVPPVIFARDISWTSIFGKVNYLSDQGTYYSNHQLLEPGLLREASGGFLVLPVSELLANPPIWQKLKNALQKGEIDWEPVQNESAIVPFFSPEPTPISVKLILVGDIDEVSAFCQVDVDTSIEVFLKTSFEYSIEVKSHEAEFCGLLNDIRIRHDLLDMDHGAVEELCRYSNRLGESSDEFVIIEAELFPVMSLSDRIARDRKSDVITREDVSAAIMEQFYRASNVIDESVKLYQKGQILIQVTGSTVGQINGLGVLELTGANDISYGEPLRITATVHQGDGESISDVEHKADLAGQIHQKAMMIINGYFLNLFGQEAPSGLEMNLVFEQNYSGVDGDSASLSGLLAILSALSKIPIRQDLAVTGSLDQFGNIQAVGGLNEKVEGFFRICRLFGLTGKQGVVLPRCNITNLTLHSDVVSAIAEGKFHIYPVSRVEEAVQLLLETPAEGSDEAPGVFDIIQERFDEVANRNERISLLKRLVNAVKNL